ncbi:probable phenylacetyl-CoA ligase [Cephalotrichum gorgonifer]|uniref:Probable phenylacetyl-CoA ligase n=1 Tax=Cephalotrichum gorgonifer TaxID=2041049 RepID=A0AAE8SUF3_9PEZI|nr:probable phenylacetyl-CoA ligase [Cephalotrichum gorgonifer]
MVFHPPSWVPQLPIDPPDSVPLAEFMRQEQFGRHPSSHSRNPFTCGLTGRTYPVAEFFQRSELIARALAKRLGWSPNEGTAWDKVLAIFSLNTIDYITAAYGVHRLSGIVTPANAAYSAEELQHQLRSSGTKALITCVPLLETALRAAKGAGIPEKNVFILDLPGLKGKHDRAFTSVEDLVSEGRKLAELEELRWVRGQGARQAAFLCYSSGTSGLPKAVMISHRNIIANVLQHTTYESVGRRQRGVDVQNVLGFLPFSHIYALVVIAHSCTFRGDGIVVLPKFDFVPFLKSVQEYKINQLILVPPVIINMLQNKDICRKYDLSSVRFVFSGAAPLGDETIREVQEMYPAWTIAQAYGMTETSVVVTSPSEHDIYPRASGSLLPSIKAKIIDADGNEVTEHEKPGELLIQSPAVVLGYLNNEKATSETFVFHDDGRWIRTGDEAVMAVSPSGNEQIVIVDRIKELIKVKGYQVAPAELEAHILAHPYVSDCAVIQIPDPKSGEVPKAFAVKASLAASLADDEVAKAIVKHVADHKAPYKWIKGGVEFLPEIPKSPSGKILRRLLRDQEKAARKKTGAKL